jgi:transcriptional regulator
MYIKERYLPNSPDDVRALIHQYPLATIVSRDALGLSANHLPLVLDPEKGPNGTLIGHMARANPQCEALRRDPHVLVIFTGPSGYISSSWYTERDSAPTWNYAAVHCHGQIVFSENDEHTLWAIQRLLDSVEVNRPNEWKMSELGAQGITRRLPFIIGFEIEITSIEAKFQMSQYERPEDTSEAIRMLERDGNAELARTMHECNFASLNERKD